MDVAKCKHDGVHGLWRTKYGCQNSLEIISNVNENLRKHLHVYAP